jgi:putative YphP/YqiW family bacilliredoxin
MKYLQVDPSAMFSELLLIHGTSKKIVRAAPGKHLNNGGNGRGGLMQPFYDREAVRPMWEELAQCGVRPLKTVADVDAILDEPGTTLIVVNSVCGCAAGSARPGVTKALQSAVIPDHLTTVFAGVDREATERARERMAKVAPSSPSVALFKDGKLVYALERRHIERMGVDEIARELANAFAQHCTRMGPSVPADVYDEVVHARRCGSQIPSFRG